MEHENHMFRFRLNDFTEDLSYCFASAFLSLAVNRSSTGGDYDLHCHGLGSDSVRSFCKS